MNMNAYILLVTTVVNGKDVVFKHHIGVVGTSQGDALARFLENKGISPSISTVKMMLKDIEDMYKKEKGVFAQTSISKEFYTDTYYTDTNKILELAEAYFAVSVN
jgi:hypothetical protein